MTTYNSYEAAKIANPEYAIFEYQRNFGTDEEILYLLDKIDVQSREMKECNPADHCMTVEKFLADGHKFELGDACLDEDGCVININVEGHTWNKADEYDDTRFILRAAALETKEPKPFLQTGEEFEHTKTLNFIYERMAMFGESPSLDYMHKFKNAIMMVEKAESPCNKKESIKEPKRAKESYEKVKETIWSLESEFRSGELYRIYAHQGDNPMYGIIESEFSLIQAMERVNVFRRTETPIEWWEDAKDFVTGGSLGHFSMIEDRMLIESAMTRDQWCDFARILLEQGE